MGFPATTVGARRVAPGLRRRCPGDIAVARIEPVRIDLFLDRYAVETHATRKVITQQVDFTRSSVELARDAFRLNVLEVYRQANTPVAVGAGRLEGPSGELMQAMAIKSHQKLYERLLERTFPEAIAELRALERSEGGDATR